MKLKGLLQVIACITFFTGVANAQVSTDMSASTSDMAKTSGADGWSKSLKFSGSGGLAIHNNHLTETNGEAYNLGGKLDGTMTWREGNKEWRNSLLVDQSTSKTPAAEHYIKGTDIFKIQSFYLWGLEGMPKFGPYAKASYDTSIFKNHKYLTEPATVNGVAGVNEYRLSDGFGSNPQTLKASLGVFYKAIEEENMSLVLSAGLGGMRVWVKDAFVAKDVDGVGTVITELKDYTDYGLVLGLDLKGKFDDKTGYSVGFESLTPFDAGDDPATEDEDLIKLTNYEGFARIDSKLYDWLSVGYEFRVRMQPKLQQKEQVSNIFGLSLTYILL